eukprot:1160551-Pelagomonas_calceolata.AAC.3
MHTDAATTVSTVFIPPSAKPGWVQPSTSAVLTGLKSNCLGNGFHQEIVASVINSITGLAPGSGQTAMHYKHPSATCLPTSQGDP